MAKWETWSNTPGERRYCKEGVGSVSQVDGLWVFEPQFIFTSEKKAKAFAEALHKVAQERAENRDRSARAIRERHSYRTVSDAQQESNMAHNVDSFPED